MVVVWRNGNSVGHTNTVKVRQACLVLELVTTFGGSTFPVFILATQPGHPSVGRCNDYWKWFRSGKKLQVLRNSGSCYLVCYYTSLL